MPSGLVEPSPPAEHAVQLVDQEHDGLVALVDRHRSVHFRTIALDVSLRAKAPPWRLRRIVLEFHPESDDAFLVAEQTRRLLLDERFKGRCEVEVDTGNNHFTRRDVIAHDLSFRS